METAKLILKYEGKEDVTLDTKIPLTTFSALDVSAQLEKAKYFVAVHVLALLEPNPVWPNKIILPSLIHSLQLTGTFQ